MPAAGDRWRPTKHYRIKKRHKRRRSENRRDQRRMEGRQREEGRRSQARGRERWSQGLKTEEVRMVSENVSRR